jgi:hypothetical protein
MIHIWMGNKAALRNGRIRKKCTISKECYLEKRTPHMKGMPTKKKDTPQGRIAN